MGFIVKLADGWGFGLVPVHKLLGIQCTTDTGLATSDVLNI